MRIPPSIRKNANHVNNHHLNWRRKEWINESRYHHQAREIPTYQLPLRRMVHDLIHVVFEPIRPPHVEVAKALIEVGEIYENDPAPLNRLESAVNTLHGWAEANPSPELADGMREVSAHYAGQLAVIRLLEK